MPVPRQFGTLASKVVDAYTAAMGAIPARPVESVNLPLANPSHAVNWLCLEIGTQTRGAAQSPLSQIRLPQRSFRCTGRASG